MKVAKSLTLVLAVKRHVRFRMNRHILAYAT